MLEVFREFTEKGQVKSISSILASQVNNIEVATKALETKTRAIKPTKLTKPIVLAIPANFAQIASLKASNHVTQPQTSQSSLSNPTVQNWTLVQPKSKAKTSAKPKEATKRLILIKAER